MKKNWASYVIVLLATAVMYSCSSSSEADDEFVATLDDFSNYTSWNKTQTLYGEDALLKTAHGTTDSLYRTTYFSGNVTPSGDEYPNGTIIVKELRDEMGTLTGALTMMVKRGGDFNPDGNGWEYFMTDIDLSTIYTQGDNETAGDGMCAGCHAAANSNNNGIDWVFAHTTAQ